MTCPLEVGRGVYGYQMADVAGWAGGIDTDVEGTGALGEFASETCFITALFVKTTFFEDFQYVLHDCNLIYGDMT